MMNIDVKQIKTGGNELLEKCFERFGSLNKNDYEVALFHLLLMNGYADKSDHFMSKMLQIPESKVKRLRYESYLVYPKTDEELKEEFYGLLKGRSYKMTNDNKIQFVVNDKMLRLYLNDKLDEVGSFSDSSFNSNIVTISPMDMMILLFDFEKKLDVLDRVKEETRKHGMLLPKNLSEKSKELFVAVLKDIGRHVSKHVTDYIEKSLVNTLNQ
jgi:hypothetical protein